MTDMADVYGEFADIAEGLSKEWNETRAIPEPTLDGPLFHYTSAAGLLGIFESRSLWCSSVFHMNDPTELRYGLRVATEHLLKHAKESDDPVDQVVWQLCDMLKDRLNDEDLLSFYLGSFSRDPDELGQWRAYGDDGRGFSIGFAPQVFVPGSNLMTCPAGNLTLMDVNYDLQSIQESIGPKVDRAIDATKKAIVNRNVIVRGLVDQLLAAVGGPLAVEILFDAVRAKHKAYKAEAESRTVIVTRPDLAAPHVRTRNRGATLVSYLTCKVDVGSPGIVTDIVIGPSAHIDAESAIKSLLARFKLQGKVRVYHSDIPYRSPR